MRFPRIAITARTDFPDKEDVLKTLVATVKRSGADVSIDPERCDIAALKKCRRFGELKNIDLIIVVGGDGTILRTVRDLKDFSVPLLTINRGTVGFLTECDTTEIETAVPRLLKEGGILEERQMLSCAVLRDAAEIITAHALNEIVISQGTIARLIQLRTKIAGVLFATFRADGIIIATPTGSTAYNLSAGGPILHPHSRNTVITPINAYTLSQKPMVVPSDATIEVEILHRGSAFGDVSVSLTLDGQTHHALQTADSIVVRSHAEKVRFLKRRADTFYGRLREKLGWGE